MYKAYIGSEILLDPSSDITLSEPCLELVDNSAGSFTFHIHPDHPLYDQLKPTSRIDFYKVRNGEEEWVWSGRPIRSELQFELNKEVTCEGVLAWLADSVQEPAEYHDVTVMGLLDIFLTKHNQQVEASKRIKLGAVTVTDSNNSLFRYTNYENTLEAIQDKLVDRLGGHLRLRKEEDGFYLDYLADYPRTSAQAIEFGENLMDLFKENTFEEIGTVLIPLGAALEDEEKDPNFPAALEQRVTIRSVNNGSDMLVNETGVEEFGKIVRVEKWDDVHVPSILKSKAEQYLNVIRYESKTVTATAVDLSLAGIDTDDFRFLDRILVHSTPHDIDLSFPLVEMKIYPLSPESNQYTLGGAARSYIKKSSQTLSEVKSLVEMKPSISYVRKVAIDNATKILNQWAGMGYAIHTENESFFMDHPDKDEAKNVLRINMGGIGFSSTGIEGPYTYAWTLDGTFNTQFINAGSITADQLAVDYKQTVQQQITLAEQNAKDDTEEKLKSYWTQLEVETQIKNTADRIRLQAKEEAKAMVDGLATDVEGNVLTQLVNYYTKAEIDVQKDQITQSVSEKVGNSEFSTKLRQSATDIQIAWNKINQYIQFETLSGEARMSIYEPDGSSKNRLMSLGQKGMWFYRDNITIGKIGTNSLIDGSTWNGNREPRGLVFDVEAEGDYMAWATKYYSTDEHYRVRLLFTNANMYLGSRPREKGRFYFYSGIEMQNHIIWDADFRFSDLGSGYVPVQRRGDGNYVYIPTDKSFSNCLKCKVDNGILMIENK